MAATWICQLCAAPIVLNATHTKKQLGKLCIECYNKKMKEERKKKPRRTRAKVLLFSLNELPTVFYCPTCWEKRSEPGYCSDTCRINGHIVEKQIVPSTMGYFHKRTHTHC